MKRSAICAINSTPPPPSSLIRNSGWSTKWGHRKFLEIRSSDLGARQLVLPPRHRSPEPLFRIRHEAQNQFLRHQSLDHPFAVEEIVLSPVGPVVALGLAQVQRTAHLAGSLPLLAHGLPEPLQHSPHRLPVL